MKKYNILMFHKTGLSGNQIRDEFHVAEALQELGHTIYTNDESKISEVDLILCFKSNEINADMIKKWKTQTNVPIWAWTFDDMNRASWFYPIAKEVDLWLGEELGRTDRFKEEGLPFYYFPNHAGNPKYLHPFDLPKIYDVVFTGTPYFQERIDMLKAIQNAGISLSIFGNDSWGWKSHGFTNVYGSAFDEMLANVISQSKIVVGINSIRCYGAYSIRAAQVMLCGGFIIEQYSLGMERELRDGCEYWNTIDELLEKIKYYLEHEDERNAIAKRGYEIAITTLTNKSRCAELIKLFENYNKYKQSS